METAENIAAEETFNCEFDANPVFFYLHDHHGDEI